MVGTGRWVVGSGDDALFTCRKSGNSPASSRTCRASRSANNSRRLHHPIPPHNTTRIAYHSSRQLVRVAQAEERPGGG